MSQPTGAPLLIVEDDSDLQDVLADLFELNAIRVVRAHSAREAIARLNEGPHPGAVLLDLGLPDLSGEHVIEWLREQPLPLRRTPVIVFTGSDDWSPAGADAVFRKPADTDLLLRLMKRLCMRPTGTG